jgi:hypothetical protein
VCSPDPCKPRRSKVLVLNAEGINLKTVAERQRNEESKEEETIGNMGSFTWFVNTPVRVLYYFLSKV